MGDDEEEKETYPTPGPKKDGSGGAVRANKGKYCGEDWHNE
ncbi:MAG: hypothetical protein ABH950_06270 [Candidatus Altiarchaeota archaeon]